MTASPATTSPVRELVSYLTLRKAVGILGVLLPVLVVLIHIVFGHSGGILTSISAYYGSVARDVFVGILFTFGWFLFAYRGYERKDDLFGDLGCLFAVCVALLPTTSSHEYIRIAHYVSAACLFLVFSYFSLFLFTKTGGPPPTPEKKRRNTLYRTCGVIMLVCIALIFLYSLFLKNTSLASFKPVFWLESLALWAFGISWATKGEMLWKDAHSSAP